MYPYDSPPHPQIIAFLENLGVTPAFLNEVHSARQAAALAFCIGLQFPLCFPSETCTDHLTHCFERFLMDQQKKTKPKKNKQQKAQSPCSMGKLWETEIGVTIGTSSAAICSLEPISPCLASLTSNLHKCIPSASCGLPQQVPAAAVSRVNNQRMVWVGGDFRLILF